VIDHLISVLDRSSETSETPGRSRADLPAWLQGLSSPGSHLGASGKRREQDLDELQAADVEAASLAPEKGSRAKQNRISRAAKKKLQSRRLKM